jgi:tape measure domain-containing protein
MAAQDAELKLKVSLDLAFFRQQLAGLGQVAAGYSMPINVKFDRRSVQNELNALGANIRRRNYRLNIETNLSAEIAKADTLARKLNELSGKIKASAGSAFSKGPQGAAGLEKFMRDQGLTGRAFGVQQAQENIAKQAILARLEKKSLEKGGYNVPGLKKIIRDLGGTPTGGRTDLVAQAKKLVQESNGIADAVFDNLKDLQMKLKPIRGQAQTSAARSMPNLNQMLDRIANLTENPRAAQRMLRMMPESRLTTDLVGAANRQAAFKEQFPQGFRLPGFSGPKAFDPLLKAIAKDFSDYAKTVNITDPWVGQIGDGIRRVVAVSAQAAATTTKALPPIGGTTSPMSALEQRLAQSRGSIGTGGGAAASLFTGRGLVNPGVSMLSPVGISGNYRQMAAALANQAANPALAHRQIADIGFGAVPTAATGLSGNALNQALNQAFLQRRGLGIGGGQALPIFNTPGVAVQQNIPGMAYQMAKGGTGGSMGMFPTTGMMGPSSPLGRVTAQSSMFGASGPGGGWFGGFRNYGGGGVGGGGAMPPTGRGSGGGGVGGLGGFGRAMGGINLPGSGTIRELGSEFAFATKQVLLFGQAYKLLAFIQDFPGQVGQAVGQLQNFRNTLNTISPTAEEAAASNALILDLVEKYNIPLQSARDGFTKLYASMAPAGFQGDEIRDLFTGISKAAATFGMSADKVDRVNYAFAQMASKGQVMSEELKGQLGDVLPGAMALFAEAAGFKGPKAIQDFSVALEEGAYKGEAMVALLKNVGVVMNQEFGPGAEGAARTFQGVINRMQNSMRLLYESFEPVAVGFLNSVVVPLITGIKQVSDGFNAFFTGIAAKTKGGFTIAQELEQLRPTFDGIRKNFTGLIEQFSQFARVALDVGKVLLQIASNPFVGYVARVYINMLALTTAIQLLNLRALIPMIANLARSGYALIAFTVQCARAGQSAQVMGLMVKTAGITLRTFFASTGVGLVVVGISMLIERFMTMNQALEDTRAKALGAANAIRSMSQTEARIEEQKRQSGVRLLERLSVRKGVDYRKTGAGAATNMVPVSEQEAAQLEALGVQIQKSPIPGIKGGMIPRQSIAANIQQQQELVRESQFTQSRIRSDEERARQAATLAPIPPSEGDGGAGRTQKLDEYDRSQLAFIQKQFELEKRSLDKRLQGELISQTQYDIALAELKLETEKLRIAEEYRLAVSKTNADNLSASDKALKLKDLEIIKNKELAIAEDDRNIAIGAARKKIIDPILDEIDNETLAIERQSMEAKNLAEGRLKLTAAQEAELSVKERYANLSQDERENAKGELDILRQIREQRLRNAEALQLEASLQEKINETRGVGSGLRAGFFGQAASVFERAMLESDGNVDYATQMANIETTAMQLRSVFEGLQSAIGGVSEAFANVLTEGVAGMISGTATAKEVFASFLQSVGQALSQAASQMIATYIAIGIAKMFAGLGGGGGGNPAGSGGGITDSLSGMRQYAGGLGGGGAPGSMPFAPPAFANGGIVTGPTLSLIGEGKYNEAVVPLPDGRSIPVQLGGKSARDLMGGNAPGMPASPSLNMKFETTKINGVEYVSRDQLEAAMAQTRKMAASDGATKGSQMALSKLRNSPSTRRQLGF